MPTYALLVSPKAEGAYFAQTLDVAHAELAAFLPTAKIEDRTYGDMHFLTLEAKPASLATLLRLSFVQGIFEVTGESLTPVNQSSGFGLHPDFVWGEKYRGKTNETLTQLLINLCLAEHPLAETLVDPMCGRATTLLWGMRYGLKTAGIEQDPQAMIDLQRGLKKWTKLHRIKHKLEQGWVHKSNKNGVGKYLDFAAEGGSLRMVTGDTGDSQSLLQNRKFDILATDIPYGIQHLGGKNTRSPLETLRAAAPAWVASIKAGGVAAIAFNSNLPKRDALSEVFTDCGLEILTTSVAHRMSESILRDVLLMRKSL